ncbi:P protein-like [Corticium candelabrum]|uniref:P protein-like n=1 Tax=Corticium candelabrum TaxID=121492 RepID=UPI002E255831|nr:P protein-like [Corticium candelabrum]
MDGANPDALHLDMSVVELQPSRSPVASISGSHLSLQPDHDEISESNSSDLPPTETTPLVVLTSRKPLEKQEEKKRRSRKQQIWHYVRVGGLFLIVVFSASVFAIKPEQEVTPHFLTASRNNPAKLKISEGQPLAIIVAKFQGPFNNSAHNLTHFLNATVRRIDEGSNNVSSKSEVTAKEGPIALNVLSSTAALDEDHPQIVTQSFYLFDNEIEKSHLYFYIESTEEEPVNFAVHYSASPKEAEWEALYGGLILVFVYLLIVFELVHRTVAAMVGSLMALAVLSALNKRPTVEEVMEWIDYETILLLFGMMTIVTIFANTGFFDYAAVKAYKLAKGKVWPLITILVFFAGIVSAFLDNVTTILLMTPVTIKLCEVLNLDPKNVLIAEVLFSNIGGTATAVGDPPNVIIVSDRNIKATGINFASFTLHLSIGIFFCMIGGYFILRLLYRSLNLENPDGPEVTELKREARIWRRTAHRIRIVTAEESTVKALLLQKAEGVEHKLREKLYKETSVKSWIKNLRKLEKTYYVTDKPLLIKSTVILAAVVLLFFSYSFVSDVHVELGWIAVLGAVWLIVLADVHQLELLLEKIEWATLLFFAALFILMEALKEMHLIQFIGDSTASLIKKVPEEHQLLAALILIVWISAIASSFVDNIPFTTAMIPIILNLGNDESLNLPLPPLVWALAMGACLGGNGTLIGASANVVCAGLAEQYGCPFSFNYFFKYGFPMMLGTVLIATVYLVVCHVAIGWNGI